MENTTTLTPQPAIRRDIYEQVTGTIIQQLEAGTIPWHQPWTGSGAPTLSMPKNSTTGNRYKGINILLLWTAASENNFPSSEWATFKQWHEKKEAIRRGEKGSMIVYYDTFEKEVDGEVQKIPFLKTSIVFNRSQLYSYVSEEQENKPFDKALWEVIDPVEQFIENTHAVIDNNYVRACYNSSTDQIGMPPPNSFSTTTRCTATEGYYSTLMHELTHWTGHKARLNREGGKKFADQAYAYEELVAELGAAFLCADFELATLEKGNHAAYIDSWLKVFKDNKYFVVKAASEASKAVDYLHTLQP